MRLRQKQTHTAHNRGDAGSGEQRRAARGLGPFSGGQLTVVIVAIAAMLAIPTAALAATGAFSSKTTAPAVLGTSVSKADHAVAVYGNQKGGGDKVRFGVRGTANGNGGVGVQGNGKKFGVFSSGDLGVKNGSSVDLHRLRGAHGPCRADAHTNALRSARVRIRRVFGTAGGT